jgi:hypothetical protein
MALTQHDIDTSYHRHNSIDTPSHQHITASTQHIIDKAQHRHNNIDTPSHRHIKSIDTAQYQHSAALTQHSICKLHHVNKAHSFITSSIHRHRSPDVCCKVHTRVLFWFDHVTRFFFFFFFFFFPCVCNARAFNITLYTGSG